MSGKKYAVAYTPEASEDLDDIYSYIAFSLRERKIAARITNEIRKEIRDLKVFPESCMVVEFEPWHELGICRMPVSNYNVYYHVDTEQYIITVLRIFYGGRDVENIINDANT